MKLCIEDGRWVRVPPGSGQAKLPKSQIKAVKLVAISSLQPAEIMPECTLNPGCCPKIKNQAEEL